MYSLLTSLTGDSFRQAEFGEAALYALLGFLTVLGGILFLIFVIWGVGRLMEAFEKKSAPAKEKVPVAIPEPVKEVQEDEMTEELIAVITAAIAAYYQKENKKCEFTVKRIKRI